MTNQDISLYIFRYSTVLETRDAVGLSNSVIDTEIDDRLGQYMHGDTSRIVVAGNRESFKISFLSTDSILLWVLKTYWKQRNTYPRLFKEDRFLHLDIFELKNQDTADELISRFRNMS